MKVIIYVSVTQTLTLEHIPKRFQKLFRIPEPKFSVLHADVVEAFGRVNLFPLFGVWFNKGDAGT